MGEAGGLPDGAPGKEGVECGRRECGQRPDGINRPYGQAGLPHPGALGGDKTQD